MLGLRPGSNHTNNGSQNKRSHKFAEKLNGRFFVAGVSGSFQKHRKEQLGLIDNSETVKVEKYVYQPVLEKRQKEMLQQEAMALMEMEEKLSELKRVKEGRKRRNEQRTINKLRYKSAETIRRAFKSYHNRKYSTAVNTVLAFLRVTARKQALATAVWAIGVIKRFRWKAIYLWRKRRAYMQAIHLSAHMNWSFIVEIACMWTQARRNKADECVYNSFKIALQNAKKHILATDGYVPPPVHKTPAQHRKYSFIQSGTAHKKSSFFITSNDVDYSNQQQGSNDDDASVAESIRKFQGNNTQYNASDTSAKGSNKGVAHKQQKSGMKMSTAVTAASMAADYIKRGKIYNDSDANVKRLIELHRTKLFEMELERQRRLSLLEQAKKEAPPPVVVEEKKITRQPSTKYIKPVHSTAHTAASAVLAIKKFEHLKSSHVGTGAATAEGTVVVRSTTDVETIADAHVESQLQNENKDTSITVTNGEPDLFLDDLPLPTTITVVPHTRTRSTTNSKVVSKIMDAMKTAASTTERDKIIRANNFLHSVAPPKIDKTKDTEKHSSSADMVPSKHVLKKHIETITAPATISATVVEPQVAVKTKRPPVPSQAGMVELQKSKLEREAEETREQLRQLEEARFLKYNSDEALAKSRAAMQRRVALKAARKAEKELQEQAAEKEKKEKLEQLASEARKKLLLAKVRFTETVADKKAAAVKERQLKKKKFKSKKAKTQAAEGSAVTRSDHDQDDSNHSDHDHESDHERDQHNDADNSENEHSDNHSECSFEEDSLDIVTDGLELPPDAIRGDSGYQSSRKPPLVRVNTQSPTPNLHAAASKIKFQLPVADHSPAETPPAPAYDEIITAADEKTRKSASMLKSPYCREEVHYISSAKEDYSDLIENFQVEQFFESDNDTFVPLFTSFDAPMPPHPEQHDVFGTDQHSASNYNQSHGDGAAASHIKVHTKPVHVPIPKSLQSTPYFTDYKKHSKPIPTHGGPHQGGHNKQQNKSAKKSQKAVPQSQPQMHVTCDDDHSLSNESYPPSQKKSIGRVASLMEIVERARKKQMDSAQLQQLMLEQQQPQSPSPPKPPLDHTIHTHTVHSNNNTNHNTNSSGLHGLSIPPQSTYQNGPLSAYGLATNTSTAAPTMSFKKFAAMSPSIPLPPINSTDLNVLKSAKVSVASISGKGGVMHQSVSHQQLGSVSTSSISEHHSVKHQQQQRQSGKQQSKSKNKTLNFTSSTPILHSTTTTSATVAPAVSGATKKIRKSTPKASRHGPIFENNLPPSSDSESDGDNSDSEDAERRKLEAEYAERKSAFVRKVAEATAANSINTTANNTAPTSPHIQLNSDRITPLLQKSLTKSITELYAEQQEGSHDVTTKDLLDAWNLEEEEQQLGEEDSSTEYGHRIMMEDERSGSNYDDIAAGGGEDGNYTPDDDQRYEGEEQDENDEQQQEQHQRQLNLDDDMCNMLMQNLSMKMISKG